MSDITPTGPSGPGQHPAAGEQRQTGEASTPSANQGGGVPDFESVVSRVLDAKLAPIRDALGKHEENARNARRRVAQRGGDAEDGDQGPTTETANDDPVAAKIKDADARAAYLEQQKRLRTLEKAEATRTQRDTQQTIQGDLDQAIKAGGFVNGDLLADAIRPRLKLVDGKTQVDLGDRYEPLGEYLKAYTSKHRVFLPPAVGEGAGVQRGDGSGGFVSPTGFDPLTASRAEFDKQVARITGGGGNATGFVI